MVTDQMRVVRRLALALLLFNGAGALFGSYHLTSVPDGSSLGLSLSLLEHTPFRDYFIPGVVLFFTNGVCSFIAAYTVLFRKRPYSLFVTGEGVLLLGWLVVQVMLIRTFDKMHVVMGLTAMLLVICGWWLRRACDHKHLPR